MVNVGEKQFHSFMLFVLLFFSLFLTTYCSQAPQQDKPVTCEQVRSIKINMTPDQVESLLGPPTLKDMKVGVSHWTYATEKGTWIIKFREGKVVDSMNLLGDC